jgi:hypothetical protein
MPPLMQQEVVAQYPVDGCRYTYWPETTKDAYVIWRHDVNDGSKPATLFGSLTLSDWFYWSDITTTHFRVWRMSRDGLDFGNTRPMSPGEAKGKAAAATVDRKLQPLRDLNAANAAFWKR